MIDFFASCFQRYLIRLGPIGCLKFVINIEPARAIVCKLHVILWEKRLFTPDVRPSTTGPAPLIYLSTIEHCIAAYDVTLKLLPVTQQIVPLITVRLLYYLSLMFLRHKKTNATSGCTQFPISPTVRIITSLTKYPQQKCSLSVVKQV